MARRGRLSSKWMHAQLGAFTTGFLLIQALSDCKPASGRQAAALPDASSGYILPKGGKTDNHVLAFTALAAGLRRAG